MESKSFCSVCFTNVQKKSQLKTLECNHKFHMKCIWKWLIKQPTCPVCRREVSSLPSYNCPYNEYIHFVNAYKSRSKTIEHG
jgi:hypothetical protein